MRLIVLLSARSRPTFWNTAEILEDNRQTAPVRAIIPLI